MANRLKDETSPYLLQHRDNPVDWYPWGPAAFERARAEDRPVLLSVGYSACHWCHVMEHESFEDEETARLMNEHYVSVKVDREERPDVDSVYMTAVQQMTGHGGWPMTVFLTPEGAPFYGGTYFPPEPRHGLPSFRQVLLAISQAYQDRREQVEESARELREMLSRSTSLRPPPSPLEPALLDSAYRSIVGRHDPRHGGFGGAPKFPQPMLLEFLLRHWRRGGSEDALRVTRHTLDRMWRGGMYDHVGGGFHRYSVDARWLVPHFEKMLYDNALLSRAYLHAHLATGEGSYRRVAEEVLAYVEREMTSPEGGFYSAQDADSEGEEGKFYVWDPGEIDALLGPDDGPLFRRYYDVTEAGNFEGHNILHAEREVPEVAREAGVSTERLLEVIARGREVLYRARAERVWPARDDKVLTSWNAMMMRSFAEAGSSLGNPRYVEIAAANAGFLLDRLRVEGRLLRTYRDGVAKIDGFLEDHALLADALISLYEATFDPRWIREARALAETMVERFWDEDQRIFYDAAAGGEELVVRPRDYYDSATPSGSSAAATALLRLAALTGEAAYERVALEVLESFASVVTEAPQGFGELLCAMAFHLAPPREVAIVGDPGSAATRALLRVVQQAYRPETVLAVRDPAVDPEVVSDLIPLLEGRQQVDGRPAAYVCQRFACRRPVTTPEDLAQELAPAGVA